jgi:uncharacterized integral membrane protein (TIGR00698 family)
LVGFSRNLFPGVALCVAATVAAILLERLETRIAGQPYLEALVLAILIGVALRTAWKPAPRFHAGINFSAKFVLELAIVLLGASVSVTTITALGAGLIGGIALIVAVAIATSYGIGRALRLPPRLSILIACGNSICGNSAIAAVAPVIGADGDDIASSISFTAVLGVIVVLTLPLLVPILDLSLTQYGVLAGLTVYAVPQVLAATLPIGALSNQVGTVIKLVRVLMLGPVVLGFSLLFRAAAARRRAWRAQSQHAAARRTGAVVHRRLSRRAGDPLARPDPADDADADHAYRRGADYGGNGGARPRRRCARRRPHRDARDARGHGVADRARRDELCADPADGDRVTVRQDSVPSP